MKEAKICIIATLITAIILCSCAYALPAQAEAEFYPKLVVVVNTVRIEDRLWVVECRDKDSHIWGFYDEEGTWAKGDIANLLMWNIGEREEDDEIVEVYWEGYTEDITNWLHSNGWR